jgi:hypothetical protein
MRALPLRPLEAAAGLALGLDERSAFTVGPTDLDPLEALIAATGEVLTTGPAYVSFSGGRDSSVVLAAATLAARRHGVPDPIPLTQRFAGVASTEETSWQEMVVDHLGLTGWEVIEIGEELDLLGEIARAVLTAHGPLWPPNAYFHVPMLRRARGASLMTGFDGDGVLGSWRWARAQSVLHGRVRPVPRDAARVALALAPPHVRRRLMPPPLLSRVAPWLRPGPLSALARVARSLEAAEPRRWDRRLAFHGRTRFLRLTVHSLQAIGSAHRVAIVHPILDGRFVSALARAGGPAGLGDRTALMRSLFAGALPEALLGRRAKAEFGRALWRSQARSFAGRWDGTGVDLALVDPALLRAAWRQENPLFGSVLPLHMAWLATQDP